MMKFYRLTAAVLLLCTLLLCFGACKKNPEEPAHVDYAAELKLDMASPTLKEEVTVKTYIDGDTTHFYFKKDLSSTFEDNMVKARYLSINTPESTGKIEPWGKKASNFTKERLSAATSIILESDDNKWNVDSTGNRYLVWVWYKTADMADYRNLNLEILQNGLAIASNSANNRYGETCVKAISQAKAETLYVHSSAKDPDFPYGEATPLTLKELRFNLAEYDGHKVAFEGAIIKADSGSVYIEEYDAETDMYYGITAYYETAGLVGKGLEVLTVGNRARIVGTVQEFQGQWQISGLTYSPMNPNHPDSLKKISDGHQPAYRLTDPNTFMNGKVTVTVGDESKEFDYKDLALYTSVEMKGLTVTDTYTTQSGNSKGAITLTCLAEDGTEVKVRTIVLKDENEQLITSDYFMGKTMDIKGLLDHFTYDGANEYQVKLFSIDDVTFHP